MEETNPINSTFDILYKQYQVFKTILKDNSFKTIKIYFNTSVQFKNLQISTKFDRSNIEIFISSFFDELIATTKENIIKSQIEENEIENNIENKDEVNTNKKFNDEVNDKDKDNSNNSNNNHNILLEKYSYKYLFLDLIIKNNELHNEIIQLYLNKLISCLKQDIIIANFDIVKTRKNIHI